MLEFCRMIEKGARYENAVELNIEHSHRRTSMRVTYMNQIERLGVVC